MSVSSVNKRNIHNFETDYAIVKKRSKKNVAEPSPSQLTFAEIDTFCSLIFGDEIIRKFLSSDTCCKLCDKYLLAMVFVYFKRAKYSCHQFTRENFFLALYLAHDMEEDDEETKLSILYWALGQCWRQKHVQFFRKRCSLLKRIEFRALVSLAMCEEIISASFPRLSFWSRERQLHHAGATRRYFTYYDRMIPDVLSQPTTTCSLCRQRWSPIEDVRLMSNGDSLEYENRSITSSTDDSPDNRTTTSSLCQRNWSPYPLVFISPSIASSTDGDSPNSEDPLKWFENPT
ncbi:SPDYA (predicted) [Pycnogonum litorale]